MRCSFPAFSWNKQRRVSIWGRESSFELLRGSFFANTFKYKNPGTWSWRSCSQPSKTNPNFHHVKKQYRIKCYICNTVYHLRGLERRPGLITFFPGKGEGGIRERGSNRFMVAKATRVSLDWCRLRIVPPGTIERGRDERASEYHFRAILLPPKWSRLPEMIPNSEMIPKLPTKWSPVNFRNGMMSWMIIII